jgi:hypothetical protein
MGTRVTTSRAPGRLISRAEIVERAETWLRRPVAYSQTRFHATEHGIYRTDCSGYVSMAWALPGRPPDRYGGLNTVGLVEVSLAVAKRELLPGDVLIRSAGTNLTRHVVLFGGWADGEGTAYWGYEQASGGQTRSRVIPYPYDVDPELYEPRRYARVLD